MSTLRHRLQFDIDHHTLDDILLDLPVAYAHVIELDLVKGGARGHQLQPGDSIELLFDGRTPVDEGSPLFTILTTDWVWNADKGVYEGGFNATIEPLSQLAISTFGVRLKITEGGLLSSPPDFHARFRSAGLPPALKPFPAGVLPEWFTSFWLRNFRFTHLPDKPSLPAPTNSVNQSSLAIPAGAGSVTPTIPTGQVLTNWYVRAIVDTEDTVEVSQQLNFNGSIRVLSPPVASGTHELILLTFS